MTMTTIYSKMDLFVERTDFFQYVIEIHLSMESFNPDDIFFYKNVLNGPSSIATCLY